MNVLVTGITGYMGSVLAPALQRDGHAVRGFARQPERVTLNVPVVGGDAISGDGLSEALDGIDVAYYLIHSMERGGGDSFQSRERLAAERFGQAARDAGVSRIVYLGGPVPPGERRSPHLTSRLAVEQVLLEAVPGSVALRASIVIRPVTVVSLPRPACRAPSRHRTAGLAGESQPPDRRTRCFAPYLVRAARQVKPLTGLALDVDWSRRCQLWPLDRAHRRLDAGRPARRPPQASDRDSDREPGRRRPSPARTLTSSNR